MYLFYIDEFGDHSTARATTDSSRLKPGVSEWFVLGAVGIPDSSRQPLAEAIFELKRKHFGDDVVELSKWADSEIKGRYLYRAARSTASGHTLRSPAAFATLTAPEEVDALVDDLSLLFDTFRPVIFCIGVDKVRLLTRPSRQQVHPLGAVYAYLEQRVALSMQRLHSGQSALLVADQQAQHESYFRSGEMNRVRDALTKPLALKPDFKLVLDKPLWVDTELSSWDREILQLADIAAYSAGECFKRGEAPTEHCYLWDQLNLHMAVQWSTGNIESGGLAIYPKPQTWPRV